MTIPKMMGNHTLMVVDHSKDGGCPSSGRWVTIHRICDLVLTFLVKSKCQIPRVGIVDDHPVEGG